MIRRAKLVLCTIFTAGVVMAAFGACKDCLLVEEFEDGWDSRWVQSGNDKYNGKVSHHKRENSEEDDYGIILPTSHRFYGISHVLDKAVSVESGFVFQYEMQSLGTYECGGAYVKLLTADDSFSAENLEDSSPYSIMFGPDKCGTTNKIHLIFRHKNKKTGEVEEKHLKDAPSFPSTDSVNHLYTLIIKPDNTYDIQLDGKSMKSGSLFEDFEPAFQPPEEIDDPEDFKPSDWVDEASIPDPEATKPDDWDEDAPKTIEDPDAVKPSGWLDDEPAVIPDPNAVMPDDWDEEEDGDFEAPMIPNPKCSTGCGEWKPPTIPNPEYKGKWSAPMIDNPDYVGEWKPSQIENPGYYEEKSPADFSPIGAVAFELWITHDKILFDNVLIARDLSVAKAHANEKWQPRFSAETSKLEEARKLMEGSAIEQAIAFVQENPLVGVAVVFGLLFPIWFMCRGGNKRPTNDEHKKDDDAAVPDDSAEEPEEDEDENKEDQAASEEEPEIQPAPVENKPKKKKGGKRRD